MAHFSYQVAVLYLALEGVKDLNEDGSKTIATLQADIESLKTKIEVSNQNIATKESTFAALVARVIEAENGLLAFKNKKKRDLEFLRIKI
jgi:capsule polysaccharide export protein KpsE/RkpR